MRLSLFLPSLTVILVSRFLINLQEASLRHVKVDSDDPLYISAHSDNYRPSFVEAVPVVAAANDSAATQHFGVHCVSPTETTGCGGAISNGTCGLSLSLEMEG